MTDPSASVFKRNLYEVEDEAFGLINLHEYRMDIGFVVLDQDEKKTELPPSIGRIRMFTVSEEDDAKKNELPFVDCGGLF